MSSFYQTHPKVVFILHSFGGFEEEQDNLKKNIYDC